MLKEKNIYKMKESDFRKLNLVYKENTKIISDDGTIYWKPKKLLINDMLDKNIPFWKENHLDKLPVIICTHSLLNDKKLEILIKTFNNPILNNIPDDEYKEILKFGQESFLDKYYCKTSSSILFYPSFNENHSCRIKDKFYLICADEEVIVRKKEIDKIYLIEIGK